MAIDSELWRLRIDVGGTFTDCLALDPGGGMHRVKVLSDGTLRGRVRPGPGDSRRVEWTGPRTNLPTGFFAGCRLRSGGEELTIEDSDDRGLLQLERRWRLGEGDADLWSPDGPAVLAARLVTNARHGELLPPCEIRFATTHGTNALLERRGDPPVLFTTRGLGDLLLIGTQQRSELFALAPSRSEVLYGRSIEVDERLGSNGEVLEDLELESLEEPAREALDAGHTTAAVALLHSYVDSAHEERLARWLRKSGFRHVSTSASLSPRIKLVPRARTAVVNAYLSGVIGGVLEGMRGQLGEGSVLVMTSAGGLARAEGYQAKDSLLSGPAGGVIGAIDAGRRAGEGRVLAFDMGGTSTDVARFEGRILYRRETVVAGIELASPAIAVETVAAGGGSICRFSGEQLKVGPGSVGAEPGPACYGRGGALSLTDVNLLLGRLAPRFFPFHLDLAAAEAASADVAARHREALGEVGRDELLLGFLRIANEKMAAAVRSMSLAAGYEPAEYALLAFGGAGPQHACGLAELLDIDRVIIPADAALLSAVGLDRARLERFAERQILAPLAQVEAHLATWFEQLASEATGHLVEEGVPAGETRVRRQEVFLRLQGQDATLAVDWTEDLDLGAAFLETYSGHYGYKPAARDIEVESLRLVASDRPGARPAVEPRGRRQSAASTARQSMLTSRGWMTSSVFKRRDLEAGASLSGPALVVESNSVTVVEPGWQARLDERRDLTLERSDR